MIALMNMLAIVIVLDYRLILKFVLLQQHLSNAKIYAWFWHGSLVWRYRWNPPSGIVVILLLFVCANTWVNASSIYEGLGLQGHIASMG